MKRPSVRLNTIVACFLTVAAVTAAPAMQAGQGVVTGLVTDAITGVPIPGAVVTVSPGGVAAVTNAAGGYQVIVPAGTISLTAAAPNRPVQSIFGVIVTNGGETTVNFAVSLPGGTGVLTGHVRNAATNPPVGIAGATVTVSPGGMSTASDATGRYQITLPVGTYTVTASVASHETAAASGVKVSNQIATTQDLQLPPKGAGSGVLDVLHAFAPTADGISPESLIQATDGDFYGTARNGGAMGYGTIFKMTPAGEFTVLHAFAGGVGGSWPKGLVQGTDGDFYGTAGGGASGFGTAFRMTPDGTVTILHEFAGGADAKYPSGALVQDTHGDFYGTSSGTGSGEVFKMTRDGTIAWVHAFSNALPDGRYPSGQLVVAADGNLYGTTFQGGTSGQGTVFRITPDGTFTRLYSFTGGSDGGFPATGLIQGSDGNLYGAASSVIFKVTPAGGVSTFRFLMLGAGESFHRLLQVADGGFYLTTFGGETWDYLGSIFRIAPAGAMTRLHQSDYGSAPCAGLIQGTDGQFYGTQCYAYYVGQEDGGTLFRMTVATAPAVISTERVTGGPIASPIPIRSGAKSEAASIPLKTGSIAGDVRDVRTNAPVSNALLRFHPGGSSVTTDRTGRYVLTLPAGTYTVTVSAAGSRHATRSGIVVVNHATTTLDVRLSRPPARGSVLDVLRFETGSEPRHSGLRLSKQSGPAVWKAKEKGDIDTLGWEIEAFGGASFASQPSGGTGALPPAGTEFITATGQPSRRVSSWYFGDGAQLLNGVNQAMGVGQQITPLDAALHASLVEGNSGAGGVRVSRMFTPRLAAELTVEFSSARAELSNDAATAIENSRASFLSAWNGLASAGQFVDATVTSVSNVQIENGRQTVVTGALTVALKKTGKAIPYLTLGAGVRSHSGTSVTVGLVGDYRFALGGTPFHETDAVTVRYSVASHAMVGVLGAGLKYMMSPRVGLRFDYRMYLGANSGTTSVDSNPVVSTMTPSGSGASATTPGIQFSNDYSFGIESSLSGPPIADFRAFTGSGVQRYDRLTIGMLWRF